MDDPIRIGMPVRDAGGQTLGRVVALGEAGFQTGDDARIRSLDEIERVQDGVVFLKLEHEIEVSPEEFEEARMTHDAFVADHPAREDPAEYQGGLHLSPDDLTDARMSGLHGG